MRLFVVCFIALLLCHSDVLGSKDSFSITNFAGGPAHESILFSAFNKVFTPKGVSAKDFTAQSSLGDYTKGPTSCIKFIEAIQDSAGYQEFKKQKATRYLKCSKYSLFPTTGDLLKAGAQWNDMPCFDETEPWKPCMIEFVSKFTSADSAFQQGYLPEKTAEGYDVVSQSHFGEKQHYHAMAPTGKEFRSIQITNAEVRDKILEYARHNWERACSPRNHPWALTYIGRLLHTVQDSYSEAHVYRAKGSPEYLAHLTKDPQYREKGVNVGDVIFFQGYDAQDHKKHGAVEGMFSSPVKGFVDRVWSSTSQMLQSVFNQKQERRKYSYVNINGAMAARDRCVTIWQFWKETLNPDLEALVPTDYEKCIKVYEDKVEPFLRDTVFKFAEVQCEGESAPRDASQMYAGGSTRDFINEQSPNIKLPCGGQYVSKLTLDRYFNGEWSQFEGMAPVKTHTPEEDRVGPLVPYKHMQCHKDMVGDCATLHTEADCLQRFMHTGNDRVRGALISNCIWKNGKCRHHYVNCVYRKKA